MHRSPAEAPSLVSIRRELESIDRAIVLLIAARVEVACSAIRVRSRADGSLVDPAQEALVFARAKAWAEQAGLEPSLVDTIFRAVVSAGKEKYGRSSPIPGTTPVALVGTQFGRPRIRSVIRVVPEGESPSAPTHST